MLHMEYLVAHNEVAKENENESSMKVMILRKYIGWVTIKLTSKLTRPYIRHVMEMNESDLLRL